MVPRTTEARKQLARAKLRIAADGKLSLLGAAVELTDNLRADYESLELFAACWRVVGDCGPLALRILDAASEILAQNLRKDRAA